MMSALRIEGMGMFTAVGMTAEETWSAVARRVQSPRETPLVGLDGRPIVASLALPIAPGLTGLACTLAVIAHAD